MENCPQIQSKTKQKRQIYSNYKASPIDFETQISLRREGPPNISPSKRAFEKYKLRNFTVIELTRFVNLSTLVVLIVIGLCAVNNNRVVNVGYVKEIGITLI